MCSSSGHVTGVCEALSIMSYERRPLTKDCMPSGPMGRTFLTVWMAPPTEEEDPTDPSDETEPAEGMRTIHDKA